MALPLYRQFPPQSLLFDPFRDNLFIVVKGVPHCPYTCPGAFFMSTADLNFHIGDKVVYPNHGVGVIEQISSRSIGATIEKFYLLNIKASSLKVMVPCANVGSVGLRRGVRHPAIPKKPGYLTPGHPPPNTARA